MSINQEVYSSDDEATTSEESAFEELDQLDEFTDAQEIDQTEEVELPTPPKKSRKKRTSFVELPNISVSFINSERGNRVALSKGMFFHNSIITILLD